MGQRLPASIVMHHDGEAGYSIDADKSMDPGVAMNVLAEYVRAPDGFLAALSHLPIPIFCTGSSHGKAPHDSCARVCSFPLNFI